MKRNKIEIFKSASVIDTHAHVVLEETEKSAGALGPEMLFDGQTPVYRIGDYHLKGVNYKNTAFMDPKIRIEKMDVAILLLVWRRPILTKKIISSLRKISPKKIYVSSIKAWKEYEKLLTPAIDIVKSNELLKNRI